MQTINQMDSKQTQQLDKQQKLRSETGQCNYILFEHMHNVKKVFIALPLCCQPILKIFY